MDTFGIYLEVEPVGFADKLSLKAKEGTRVFFCRIQVILV